MQAAVVRVGYKVSPYLSTRTSKNAHFVWMLCIRRTYSGKKADTCKLFNGAQLVDNLLQKQKTKPASHWNDGY